ncbi:MAG: TSUP family transporter [Gammaproteobacteria bacterium]|nr:TSUP family transporter [Gammaproteobacteria bacterium]
MQFTSLQLLAISLIFVWSGFVRAGLGFGGAALSLPLLFLVADEPLFFLPIIALHLLFFSFITASHKIKRIHWPFIKTSMQWMLIPKLAGVIGLLSLPAQWMVIIIYGITMFYALQWVLQKTITSDSLWADRVLLILGGYFSGVSLVGAPLIAAVAMRQIPQQTYRDTLFVLWFMLVIIKVTAFVIAGVDLQWQWAGLLIIPAAIGHIMGLKAHNYLLTRQAAQVHQILGIGLLTISSLGLFQLLY